MRPPIGRVNHNKAGWPSGGSAPRGMVSNCTASDTPARFRVHPRSSGRAPRSPVGTKNRSGVALAVLSRIAAHLIGIKLARVLGSEMARAAGVQGMAIFGARSRT